MTRKTRSLLSAAALAVGLTALLAGCSGGTSTVRGAALASAAPSPAGRVVYLAEGGSVGGTVVHAPSCKAGCALSGDSTTSLWNMTWATWNSTLAVGRGTEKLDDCTPNCAAGTLHAVPVLVTLSRPVKACAAGAGKWFWTRVSFTWPAGLPAVFSGDNAPSNPFDYQGITAAACP
jgi:hypothetical protein